MFSSRFSRSIDSNFDGFGVRGHLRRKRADGDGQRERLASTAPAHKSQVVELRHLVLHDGGTIPELGHHVFVISGLDGYQSAVLHVVQSDHFERQRQRLVGAPVPRQRRAQHRRGPGLHQLAVGLPVVLVDVRVHVCHVGRGGARVRQVHRLQSNSGNSLTPNRYAVNNSRTRETRKFYATRSKTSRARPENLRQVRAREAV